MSDFTNPFPGDYYRQSKAFLRHGLISLVGLAVCGIATCYHIQDKTAQATIDREHKQAHQTRLDELERTAELDQTAQELGVYWQVEDLTLAGHIHGVTDPLSIRPSIPPALQGRLAPGTAMRIVSESGVCLGFLTRNRLYLYFDYPGLCEEFVTDSASVKKKIIGADSNG